MNNIKKDYLNGSGCKDFTAYEAIKNIGDIEIPDLDKLPKNNVSVHTRQGVDVHYAA